MIIGITQNRTVLQSYEQQCDMPIATAIDAVYKANKEGSAAESWSQEFMQETLKGIRADFKRAGTQVDPAIED